MLRQDNRDRAETLAALPTVFTALRQLVMTSCEAGDPESDELRNLLEACVVGAHRLKLREEQRAVRACVQG